MTTHAPPKPGALPVEDQAETVALEPASAELIVDSARLLDHRSRGRLIPMRLASRGRYLAFQDGEETLLHALDSNITHIGRSALAEVRIEDKRISRDHAIVVRHGSYARLLDNRSANGTFLNGRRIIATNLQDGDVIRLGSVALQYFEIA
jgi:hypothetical protein